MPVGVDADFRIVTRAVICEDTISGSLFVDLLVGR